MDREQKKPEAIGERIRQRRKALRLTQQDVATAVGVTRGAISQWESGMVEALRVDHTERLGAVLGCSIAWIMSGREDEPDAPAVNPAGAQWVASAFMAFPPAQRAAVLQYMAPLSLIHAPSLLPHAPSAVTALVAEIEAAAKELRTDT